MSIFVAVTEGDYDRVEELLDSGLDVNVQDNDNGQTALIGASRYGHTAIIKLLLEKGANIDIQDKYGNTALFWASWRGHTDIVKLLLENGAHVDLQNKYGNTALYSSTHHGYTAIVRLLLKYGANVDLQNNDGRTALYWASYRGHTEIVNLLTRHKQIKEWRPSNHENLPKPFRKGMTTLVLLAKMIYK